MKILRRFSLMKSHFMTSFWKGSNFKWGWRVSVIPMVTAPFRYLHTVPEFRYVKCIDKHFKSIFQLSSEKCSVPPGNKVKAVLEKEKKEKNKTKQNKKNSRLKSTPRQLVALGWCSSQRLWGPYHPRSNGNFGSLTIFVVNVVLYIP